MGYRFTGPDAISSLTFEELLLLQLGWLVRQEQQQEASKRGPGGRRKYSKPAKTTREAMREYAKKN